MTVARSDSSHRARYQRTLAVLWLCWAAAVVAVYYKQLWHLLWVGIPAWVRGNYSLATAYETWRMLAADPRGWGLPAFGEALSRMLSASLGAGLVLLAAQVLGLGICRLLRWQPANWREGLLYRTSAGLGAISYISLGLAALGVYYPSSVRAFLIAILAVGILAFGRQLARAVAEGIRSAFKGSRKVRLVTKDRIWQGIALLAVLIAWVGAVAPEVECDALWYHLWMPRLWLEQGRPVDLVHEYISLYPLTWELIFSAGMVFGGPVAAKLLHFVCLPLVGLLAYQLTRRFMPRASPWLAVALCVTIPMVLWEATTAYVDLALALLTGLVVYALLRYAENRQWQWLALATLNLGLALATKHLGMFVLVLAVGGLALRLWLQERNLIRALTPALLLGGLSLLIPLPWYIRNWLASGNPFFPDLYRLFGAFPPERWNDIAEYGLAHFKNHFGDPRTPLNLLLLPWNMTVHAARYGGSLGPMFLLLLPALAVRRRTGATPWLLAFALAYIALWASPISSFQMRFLVAVAPLLAVLAAESCGRLAEALPGWSKHRVAVYGGMAALLLLNLPPFTSLHESDRVENDGWLIHVLHKVPVGVVMGYESETDYLGRKVPSYNAWRYINAHLPDDTRVLTFSGGDNLYSGRDRISDIAIVAPVWGMHRGQEQLARRTLNELGVTHLLVNRRQLESGELDSLAMFQPETIADWYELEYEDYSFLVFRLR
jgi:hypothetical protein